MLTLPTFPRGHKALPQITWPVLRLAWALEERGPLIDFYTPSRENAPSNFSDSNLLCVVIKHLSVCIFFRSWARF